MRQVIFVLAAAVVFTGCSSDPKKSDESGSKATPAEKPKGADTTETAPTSAVTTPEGLGYTDLDVGTGATPEAGQVVSVHYDGTFLDGKKFDSSRDRGKPFTFPLGRAKVIKGWDIGV